MFIQCSESQTVFCKVSPACDQYGTWDCPIFTYYNDGSASILRGKSYFRSSPGYLKKPRREYTLNEIHDVVLGRVYL